MRLVSPQLRAAGELATERSVASRAQEPPGWLATSAAPARVSAIRPPPGAAASALGVAASGESSRPSAAHLAPPSVLREIGEKCRSWLGSSAATRDGPPVAATAMPPLLATPSGVASRQVACFPDGRAKTCQKSLCDAADPPITSTAQVPSG